VESERTISSVMLIFDESLRNTTIKNIPGIKKTEKSDKITLIRSAKCKFISKRRRSSMKNKDEIVLPLKCNII